MKRYLSVMLSLVMIFTASGPAAVLAREDMPQDLYQDGIRAGAVNNSDTVGSVKKKKNKKKVTTGYVSIGKTSGKITIKKGFPKDLYILTIRVKAAGNKNYKSTTKEVQFTLEVK